MDNNTANSVIGDTGHTALVHRKDHEGVFQIDANTGRVITTHDDRPEWAYDLALAQLAERTLFYRSRLGEEAFTADMQRPEVFAFEDLGWLCENTDQNSPEAGNEYVIEADAEHRMDVLASALGIDRETGEITGVKAEAEIVRDNYRSDEELQALAEAQAEGYAATGTK